MLKEDEAMAKRLVDYLDGERKKTEVTKKMIEFAKKEGYEVESKSTLDAEDLEQAAGGINFDDLYKIAKPFIDVGFDKAKQVLTGGDQQQTQQQQQGQYYPGGGSYYY